MTREEAIRWLKDIHLRFNPTGENLENEGGDVHLQALDMAIEALSEQKTGEWVGHELWDMPWYTCSECDFHGRNDYKFCPNCGARMLGEDGE